MSCLRPLKFMSRKSVSRLCKRPCPVGKPQLNAKAAASRTIKGKRCRHCVYGLKASPQEPGRPPGGVTYKVVKRSPPGAVKSRDFLVHLLSWVTPGVLVACSSRLFLPAIGSLVGSEIVRSAAVGSPTPSRLNRTRTLTGPLACRRLWQGRTAQARRSVVGCSLWLNFLSRNPERRMRPGAASWQKDPWTLPP